MPYTGRRESYLFVYLLFQKGTKKKKVSDYQAHSFSVKNLKAS